MFTIFLIPGFLLTLVNPLNFSLNYVFSKYVVVDFVNSTLFFLSIWTSLLMIMASFKYYYHFKLGKTFILIIQALLFFLISTFSMNSTFFFYILFECTLIPTLLLIIIWGYQPERLQAGMYFMLYTITASLPLLMSLFSLSGKTDFFFFFGNFCEFFNINLFFETSWLMWLVLTIAFLTKVPIFTLHLWLPKAHVEAPVSGSMILAAVLLKLGGYGLLRVSQVIIYFMMNFMFFFMSLALIGGLIAGLICSRQQDLKSLIAYSSVSHMSFVIVSIFSMSMWGWVASIIMMIAHGLCSSCLFMLSNFNYDFSKTRSINLMKSIMNIFPMLSFWWVFSSLFNMAAPPSINLMSEIIMFWSIINQNFFFMFIMMSISFISCMYSLSMFSLTHHGQQLKIQNVLITPDFRMSVSSFFHMFPILGLILLFYKVLISSYSLNMSI
uniref:NADH-ubiquinone oxidoreductase chain 4 n=1 Tax=Streptosyllis sp. THS1 TaxID=1898410 RepID=A0A1C9UZA4_9ANNE|nr:NADH dehydrogenase subunit 4 [Streptosyllis sp. THS1]